MNFEETIILGGGLTGLTASAYSKAPIYEASDHVGGVAASDTVEGFTFDRGIHVLQTNNSEVLEILEDIGVKMIHHNRQAYIYSHSIYTAYPFQVNTAGLPLGLRARCIWDFLRRNSEPEPTNYKEWMYRNIGRGFSDTFLIPYSEKFWSVPTNEMTFEWTSNRVPTPNFLQVLQGALWNKQSKLGTNAIFRYPATEVGYGSIALALKNQAGNLHFQHRAEKIDTAKKLVHFSNGASVAYNSLISTIPLPLLIDLCSDAPENVRNAVSKLRTNSIMVVNLGIDRPKISDCHWVHYPEKDISFFRLSYPHNFAENVTPPGMSSISAEVSYDRNNPPDPETLVDTAIRDLIRVKALDADAPIVMKMTKAIPYAYCIYDKHRETSLAIAYDWLATKNIIPAGRYGLWSYFWSDDSILSGKQAVDKLQKMRRTA